MAKKNPTLAEDQGRCLDTAICVSSGANQADSSGTPFRPSYSIYIAVPTLGMYREKGRAWSERLLSGIENIPGMKLIGLTHNDKYTDRYQFYLESETMINPWPELERAILLIFDSVAPAVMPASSYEKWRAELVKFSPSQARSEVAKELVEKVKNAREAVNFLNSSGNMPDTDTAREIYTAVTSPNIWKINTLKEKNIDILPAETAYAVKDALKTMKEYASDMMKLTEVWAARAFLPFTSPFAVSFVKGNSYGSQSQDFSFNTAEEYLDALRKKAFSETFSKDVLGLAQSAVLSVKHFPMSPYRITNTASTANIARDGATLRISMGWSQCRLHKLLVDELLSQFSGKSKNVMPAITELFKEQPVIEDGRRSAQTSARVGASANDPYGMDKLYSISVKGNAAEDVMHTEAKARYLLAKLFGRVFVYDRNSQTESYKTAEELSLSLSTEDRDKLDEAAAYILTAANMIEAERGRAAEEKNKGMHISNRVIPVAKGSKLFVQIADSQIPNEVMSAIDDLKKKYPESFGDASVVPNKGVRYSSIYINAPATSEAVGFSHKVNAALYLTHKINEKLGEKKFKTACPDDKLGIEAVIRGSDQKRLCIKYPLVAKEGGIVESILEGMDEPEEHPGYEVKDPVSKALWEFHSSFGKAARQARKFEKDPERKEYLKKFEILEKFVPAKAQLEKHTNTIAYTLPEDQKEAEREIGLIQSLIEEKIKQVEEANPAQAPLIKSWLDYRWMPDTTAKAMKDVNNDIRKYGADVCMSLMDAADRDASIEKEDSVETEAVVIEH